MRLGIGGAVAEIGGIEDRDVGALALGEEAAVAQLQRARRAAGHLVDRLLQRQQALVMHVVADDARKGAVEARMRHSLPDDAVIGDAIAVGADQAPSGDRTIVRMSSSEIEAISTRVAPLSSIRRSQTWSIGSTPRAAASAAIVLPACCGAFGEIETCTASQDGMRPQLLRPLSAISASMRARISGCARRASIAALSPTCTQGGSRFFSGLAPAS